MPTRDESSVARRILGLIDLTDLSDTASDESVARLCRDAVAPFGATSDPAATRVAAVCVWPAFVAQCAAVLAGTGVRVATVVNFPSGADTVTDVVALAEACVADGANEIDVVIPYRRLIAGDVAAVTDMVAAVVAAVATTTSGVHVKAILETGELPDQHTVRIAAEAAIAGGAHFVKTSTGKTPVSATLEAAETMLHVISQADREVGLKPSGGIRTVGDAARYLDLADEIMGADWATPETFRFGASGLLTDVVTHLS